MKEIIENHIKENIRSYLMLALVLIIGLIIGTIMINGLSLEQKDVISNYFDSFILGVKNSNKINYLFMLKETVKSNLLFIFISVFISFSIWGNIGNILLVGYKGFCLGYSISSAIAVLGMGKGLIFSLTLILISEMICIPAILCIIVISSQNYKKIVEGNYENKKLLIIKYVIYIGITVLITIVASLIQTYISSNLFLMFSHYF